MDHSLSFAQTLPQITLYMHRNGLTLSYIQVSMTSNPWSSLKILDLPLMMQWIEDRGYWRYRVEGEHIATYIPVAIWACLFAAYSLKALSRCAFFSRMVPRSFAAQRLSCSVSLIITILVWIGIGTSSVPIMNSIKDSPITVSTLMVWSKRSMLRDREPLPPPALPPAVTPPEFWKINNYH